MKNSEQGMNDAGTGRTEENRVAGEPFMTNGQNASQVNGQNASQIYGQTGVAGQPQPGAWARTDETGYASWSSTGGFQQNTGASTAGGQVADGFANGPVNGSTNASANVPVNGSTNASANGPAYGGANAAMNGSAYGGFGQERVEELKTAHFYNEHHQRPQKTNWRQNLAPIVAVALLSSVLGGAMTGAYLQFFQSSGSGRTTKPITLDTVSTSGNASQIEIVNRTDSPVTAIAQKVGPSIVGVSTKYSVDDTFFGTQDSGGEGSGIIISSDGYILTNNHVIEGALEENSRNTLLDGATIDVVLPNQQDRTYPATVVGRDAKTDIAVLKVDLTGLPAVTLGDSDDLQVGEPVVAIGNPAGLEFMGSVTTGIVSGLNRSVDTGEGTSMKLIQTDAAINPGNSGGALVNYDGEVIGMNSSKISGSSYEGLGFAIPSNTAKEIAENLINNGYVKGRPLIGVSIDNSYTADVAMQNGAPEGALVAAVTQLSSAYNAGVKVGDIITRIDGIAVDGYNALEEQKNTHKPGDVIELEIYRVPDGKAASEGETLTLKVTLGEYNGEG